MDRRSFIESCTAGAACMSAGTALPAIAADAKPKAYPRALLVNELGEPVLASKLKVHTNYIFHYPFEATPVFLLDLGKTVPPQALSTKSRGAYAWPGGVGAGRSIVAYSAICAHQLVYPTKEVSFISFRKTSGAARRAGPPDPLLRRPQPVRPGARRGGAVGPGAAAAGAVLLVHDPKADTLTAHATLGGELFDAFFRKYEMKLSLDVGPKARSAVSGQAVVRELDKFCRNSIQC